MGTVSSVNASSLTYSTAIKFSSWKSPKCIQIQVTTNNQEYLVTLTTYMNCRSAGPAGQTERTALNRSTRNLQWPCARWSCDGWWQHGTYMRPTCTRDCRPKVTGPAPRAHSRRNAAPWAPSCWWSERAADSPERCRSSNKSLGPFVERVRDYVSPVIRCRSPFLLLFFISTNQI